MTDYGIFQLCLKVTTEVKKQENIDKGLAYESLLTKTAFWVHDDEKEKIRYILFRPTSNSKWDWFINFLAIKVKDNRGIKQHAGFLACYLSIHNALNRAIANSPYEKIKFAGYSKGGAVAQKAYERLPDLHKNKKFLVLSLFASPRLYSFFTRDKLPKRMFDVEGYRYRSDIVTFVPPIIFGYAHVIQIIGLGKRRIFPFPFSIKDHYPEGYLKELKLEERW
jgi:hypothetical protein